jgi:hypothetical protein
MQSPKSRALKLAFGLAPFPSIPISACRHLCFGVKDDELGDTVQYYMTERPAVIRKKYEKQEPVKP